MSTIKIEKLAEHKQQFQTEKMKVPVVLHINDALLPEESTLLQLQSVASNDCCFHHIAGMADVHSKPGRKNATGTTVASEKFILPQVNDSDPACGMRLVRTNLTEDNITPEELDKLFKELVYKVPTKKYVGTYIPFRVVVDICRKGIGPLIDHLGIKTKFEKENALGGENFFTTTRHPELVNGSPQTEIDSSATVGMTNGSAPSRQDIFNIIPKLFLFFAQFRLGILGAAGNHFLDLMKVTDIEDEETAQKLGIKKGQYLFMVHCGSGILGQYTMYMYTAKKREHLSTAILMNIGRFFWSTPYRKTIDLIAKKIRESDFGKKEPLITFDGEGDDGKMYMAARNACSNFAHANRAVITHNVGETIQRVLGRDAGLELLYDMPHILVSKEEHFGKNIWVHRNGTSRAYGPSRMKEHPLFSQTGEPAFIPSSMSTEAYICVGTDHNESSFFSCNHGAGKAAKKTEDIVPESQEELRKKLKSKGVQLYNGQSKKVIEQDSSHYKRIEDVIAGAKANNIVKPIAKMQPISIIMY
ncbi:MAG: RtcB family protein [Candidatus Moranbacteria bacterium]|nr:RtcB family protein [Candidatus Moranbacteria bacterium]